MQSHHHTAGLGSSVGGPRTKKWYQFNLPRGYKRGNMAAVVPQLHLLAHETRGCVQVPGQWLLGIICASPITHTRAASRAELVQHIHDCCTTHCCCSQLELLCIFQRCHTVYMHTSRKKKELHAHAAAGNPSGCRRGTEVSHDNGATLLPVYIRGRTRKLRLRLSRPSRHEGSPVPAEHTPLNLMIYTRVR